MDAVDIRNEIRRFIDCFGDSDPFMAAMEAFGAGLIGIVPHMELFGRAI